MNFSFNFVLGTNFVLHQIDDKGGVDSPALASPGLLLLPLMIKSSSVEFKLLQEAQSMSKSCNIYTF